MFKGLAETVTFLLILLAVFIPLGAWKAIEIIMYVAGHIHWK
jgi:hypothetical protein